MKIFKRVNEWMESSWQDLASKIVVGICIVLLVAGLIGNFLSN